MHIWTGQLFEPFLGFLLVLVERAATATSFNTHISPKDPKNTVLMSEAKRVRQLKDRYYYWGFTGFKV